MTACRPCPMRGAARTAAWRLVKAAVESANDAILITEARLDLPGPRIEYVNAAFTRMTGYGVEEIVGQTPRILQGPKTDRGLLDRLRATNWQQAKAFTGRPSIIARTARNTSSNGASRRCTTPRASSPNGWPSSAT